ncbi:uncharacterized protein KD926_004238 [Aspergillus affinis]|uniref:uncharacterized protein n=1 Tax=Aspergillus affinis TaxID=1070780 RepID=UPI0022FF3A3D|nr:uncharacterized protein KD926_004238 [Aspergillus affinis]KAI9035243.1 hypothetical protein KD926_004238 [Aspergillus affinis]
METSIWLLAAAKRRTRQEAQDAWIKAWQGDWTSRPTKRLIEVPKKRGLKYWKGLRKATSSVLIQVRTGRIGLNAYLSKIKTRLRRKMWKELERKGVRTTSDFWTIIADERVAPAIAAFMIQTELLDQFRAVDPTATGITREWDHRDPEDDD